MSKNKKYLQDLVNMFSYKLEIVKKDLRNIIVKNNKNRLQIGGLNCGCETISDQQLQVDTKIGTLKKDIKEIKKDIKRLSKINMPEYDESIYTQREISITKKFQCLYINIYYIEKHIAQIHSDIAYYDSQNVEIRHMKQKKKDD